MLISVSRDDSIRNTELFIHPVLVTDHCHQITEYHVVLLQYIENASWGPPVREATDRKRGIEVEKENLRMNAEEEKSATHNDKGFTQEAVTMAL